jgi:hypothetical protein
MDKLHNSNPWLFKKKLYLYETTSILINKLVVNFPINRITDDSFAIICSSRSQLIAIAASYDITIVEENQKLLTIEAVLQITEKTSIK